MSEIVGTILLVGITVGLTTGFAGILITALPGPENQLGVDLEVILVQDKCPWASGDEAIRIRHLGGEALPAATTAIRISYGNEVHTYRGEDLDFGKRNTLTIGEVWRSPDLKIPEDQLVYIDIVAKNGDAQFVFTDMLRVWSQCEGPEEKA